MEAKFRSYPDLHFRLVNTIIEGNERNGVKVCYYNGKGQGSEHQESVEVYFLDERAQSGHRYSRCYNLTKGETYPAKYEPAVQFLKEQFAQFDWTQYCNIG